MNIRDHGYWIYEHQEHRQFVDYTRSVHATVNQMKDVLVEESFFSELDRLIASASGLEINSEWGKNYFRSLLLNAAKVQACVNEFERFFERFESAPGFVSKIPPTVEDLVLTMKLYYINWSTLLELVAIFMDSVFDIGNDKNNISFGSIIRNHKVQSSNLPTIIKKHKATIDISRSTMIRNEIVHRGRLLDGEIEELVTRKASIESHAIQY